MQFIFLISVIDIILKADSLLPPNAITYKRLHQNIDIRHKLNLYTQSTRHLTLFARKKKESESDFSESNEIQNINNLESDASKPKVKRTRKIKSNDKVENKIDTETLNAKKITSKTTKTSSDTIAKRQQLEGSSKLSKLKQPSNKTKTTITNIQKSSSPSIIRDIKSSSLDSFEQDFADLERSLKDFKGLDDIDDIDMEIDGNTLRGIESGEFDIDALMAMDDELNTMLPDGAIDDLDLEGLDSLDLDDVLKDMNLDDEEMLSDGGRDMGGSKVMSANEAKSKSSFSSLGGADKLPTNKTTKTKRVPKPKSSSSTKTSKTSQKKTMNDEMIDSDDDGLSDGDEDVDSSADDEEDTEMMSLLESKESTESDLFGDDDDAKESLEELGDFDFSAIDTRKVDDDDEDEDNDDDEEDNDEEEDYEEDEEEEEEEYDEEDEEGGKSSIKKKKKKSKTSMSSKALKVKDESAVDDINNIIIDESLMDLRFDSYSRDEELAPSTIAAASGYAASGQFSSKEKASAMASAAAATRAASAKRKKNLLAAGMSEKDAKAEIKSIRKDAIIGGGDTASAFLTPDDDKLMIDGFEIDSASKQLGTPPPLEEFKRLMESLGAESGLFDDENAELVEGAELTEAQKIKKLRFEYKLRIAREKMSMPKYTKEEKIWTTSLYQGGRPSDSRGGNRSNTINPDNALMVLMNLTEAELSAKVDEEFNEHMFPAPYRVLISSVITSVSEGQQNIALEVVDKVYAYMKTHTNNDERIHYQILLFNDEDDKPIEQLRDSIQMWCESYNTYHLIDGQAMKAAWGGIIPDIILSQVNLDALLNQIRWALEEDQSNGTLLTPRQRTVRLRGGANDMKMGFNTDKLETEFSVVSVR